MFGIKCGSLQSQASGGCNRGVHDSGTKLFCRSKVHAGFNNNILVTQMLLTAAMYAGSKVCLQDSVLWSTLLAIYLTLGAIVSLWYCQA